MSHPIAIAIASTALTRIQTLTRLESGPWLAAEDALQILNTGGDDLSGLSVALTALERIKQQTRTESGPWLVAHDALQKIRALLEITHDDPHQAA
jgi:hypothetical protein